MEYRILGPIEVLDGDRPVELGGPKQRAVLALLLLERGAVVPVARIIEGLWGDEPPASANGTLQAYVSNLRRALEPERAPGAASTVLVTQAPGYRLDVPAEAVDAVRFEGLLRAAEGGFAAGRHEEALADVTEALGLWRGDALAEVAYETFAQAEIGRLDELRMQARELRAEVQLALGRHAEVAAEMAPLVAAFPLRSRLRGRLMLALYRTGRQAEALRVYQEGRAVLREEVGAEPDPELQRLEEQILLQDPALDWRAPAPLAATAPAVAVGGPPLVGRDHELAALESLLIRASSGRGGVALVAGEPGIGKTRLAEELAARATARGTRCAWGRSFESEGAPAFWPWAQVLREVIAAAEVDMVAALGSEARLLAGILPELGGGGAASGAVPDEAFRFSLYEVVARALAAAADARPLLVVLDDVHWADAASLRLLRFLSGRLEAMRALVVVTYRDEHGEELQATVAALARDASVERITLRGLDEGEVGRMIAEVAPTPPSDEVVSEIAERTGGNPFFVTELVRLLGDDPTVSPANVPLAVRDVIRRRVDRLPAGGADLLTAGAVIGREFDLVVASAVAAVDDDTALDLIEAAIAAALVDEADRVGRYRFAHALVQESLLSGLSGVRRARAHRRVADVLAGRVRPDHPEQLAEHARHALLGAAVGDAAAAVEAGHRAADAAMRALAFEEAEGLAALALGAMDDAGIADPDVRFSLQLTLGVACRRRGDVAGSGKALAAAVGLARGLDGQRFAEAALARSGGTWWGWWSDVGLADDEAIAFLEEALDRLPPEALRERAAVLGRLAVELHFVPGTEERRDDLSAEALAIARGLDDDRALVEALASRHVAVWRAGNARERRVLADELVSVARRCGHLELEAFGHHFLTVAALERGDGPAAAAQLDEERRIVSRLPLPHLAAHVAWGTSLLAQLAGRFDDVERLLAENLAQTARWSEAEAFRTWSAQLAALRFDQGRTGELIEPMRTLAAREAVGAHWRAGLALMLADAGRLDEAREVFDEVAADGFADVVDDLGWAFYMGMRAEVAYALGDAERAGVLAALLEPLATTGVVLPTRLVYAGPVAYHLGSMHAVLGQLDAAEAELQAGLEEADRVGSRPYTARAMLRLARVVVAKGDAESGAALAAEAAALAAELGMARVHEQAAAVPA